MHSHKDVSLIQFQVNTCFTTYQNNLLDALLLDIL